MDAEIYRTEALELLDELEEALLELEERPDDQELVNRVFRALHTIKGSGKMFGFDEVASFTHDIETTFDAVREGRMKVNPELVSLTLASRDIIRAMVDGEAVDDEARADFVGRFQAMQGKPAQKTAETSKSDPLPQPVKRQPAIYRIRFKPVAEIFQSGTNLAPLFRELAEMGECTVVCHTEAVPALADLHPESCYFSWDIVLTTVQEEEAIRDVFIFVEDDCTLEIDIIADGEGDEDLQKHRLLGEILVDRGDISSASLNEILASKPLFGQTLVKAKAVDQSEVDAALAEQQHIRKLQKTREQATVGSIRVGADKLDTLVDLVGELVIAQARLSQHAATGDDPTATAIAEEVERLTSELRDNTMGLRMVPIGTTFSKFKRLVRDLSKDLGKDVELVMKGGETELDKTVIERLNDPLVHIVRNSVDHGIESPAVRQAAGKAKIGCIRLSAAHRGANVEIIISDDGAGLDAAKIREKALEKGLLAADAEMEGEEIFQLIFEPGFSTAAAVSDVSGRGVGMDVVQRGVASLRGSITVSSQPGEGTDIVIRLPLTMAIIDGLLVETGCEKYVIPQTVVQECFAQSREDIDKAHGNDVINVRGHMLPYVCMRKRFGIPGEIPLTRRVVLCETNGRSIGLAVDRVIGNHQTVIKPLADVYKSIESISGATILGDGSVALILDVARLAAEV